MFGIAMEIWVIAGLVVLATLFLMSMLARLYRKAGPNEALIVYGFRGTRVVQGHGTVIFPMVENCKGLSLELMSFDVAPQQDLYTKQGVAVTVEAVAQIKVKSDKESILTAAEPFLSKADQEREGLIRLVMEGHLRGIIGQLTVEEIVKQPEMVGDRMRATCADDMNKMGLDVISFTIKEIRDKNDYISNMGRPQIVEIRKQADIASALAQRDTQIQQANAGTVMMNACTCPAKRSVNAPAGPRYGTCTMLTPAISLSNSPATCIGVPIPGEAMLTLPGLALA